MGFSLFVLLWFKHENIDRLRIPMVSFTGLLSLKPGRSRVLLLVPPISVSRQSQIGKLARRETLSFGRRLVRLRLVWFRRLLRDR